MSRWQAAPLKLENSCNGDFPPFVSNKFGAREKQLFFGHMNSESGSYHSF